MTAIIIADMTTRAAIATIPVREHLTELFPAVTAVAAGIIIRADSPLKDSKIPRLIYERGIFFCISQYSMPAARRSE